MVANKKDKYKLPESSWDWLEDATIHKKQGFTFPQVTPSLLTLETPASLARKVPLISGPKDVVVLCTTKLGTKRFQVPSDAEFDLSDPFRPTCEYNFLHDPHLKEYLNNPVVKKALIEKGLITRNGSVKCTIKEFNDYRQWVRKLKLDAIDQERHLEENKLERKSQRNSHNIEAHQLTKQRQERAKTLYEQKLKKKEQERKRYQKYMEEREERINNMKKGISKEIDERRMKRNIEREQTLLKHEETEQQNKRIRIRFHLKSKDNNKKREDRINIMHQEKLAEKETRAQEMWKRRQSYCLEKMEEERLNRQYGEIQRRQSIACREGTYEKKRRKSCVYMGQHSKENRDIALKHLEEASEFVNKIEEKKEAEVQKWREKLKCIEERRKLLEFYRQRRLNTKNQGKYRRRHSQTRQSVWDVDNVLLKQIMGDFTEDERKELEGMTTEHKDFEPIAGEVEPTDITSPTTEEVQIEEVATEPMEEVPEPSTDSSNQLEIGLAEKQPSFISFGRIHTDDVEEVYHIDHHKKSVVIGDQALMVPSLKIEHTKSIHEHLPCVDEDDYDKMEIEGIQEFIQPEVPSNEDNLVQKKLSNHSSYDILVIPSRKSSLEVLSESRESLVTLVHIIDDVSVLVSEGTPTRPSTSMSRVDSSKICQLASDIVQSAMISAAGQQGLGYSESEVMKYFGPVDARPWSSAELVKCAQEVTKISLIGAAITLGYDPEEIAAVMGVSDEMLMEYVQKRYEKPFSELTLHAVVDAAMQLGYSREKAEEAVRLVHQEKEGGSLQRESSLTLLVRQLAEQAIEGAIQRKSPQSPPCNQKSSLSVPVKQLAGKAVEDTVPRLPEKKAKKKKSSLTMFIKDLTDQSLKTAATNLGVTDSVYQDFCKNLDCRSSSGFTTCSSVYSLKDLTSKDYEPHSVLAHNALRCAALSLGYQTEEVDRLTGKERSFTKPKRKQNPCLKRIASHQYNDPFVVCSSNAMRSAAFSLGYPEAEVESVVGKHKFDKPAKDLLASSPRCTTSELSSGREESEYMMRKYSNENTDDISVLSQDVVHNAIFNAAIDLGYSAEEIKASTSKEDSLTDEQLKSMAQKIVSGVMTSSMNVLKDEQLAKNKQSAKQDEKHLKSFALKYSIMVIGSAAKKMGYNDYEILKGIAKDTGREYHGNCILNIPLSLSCEPLLGAVQTQIETYNKEDKEEEARGKAAKKERRPTPHFSKQAQRKINKANFGDDQNIEEEEEEDKEDEEEDFGEEASHQEMSSDGHLQQASPEPMNESDLFQMIKEQNENDKRQLEHMSEYPTEAEFLTTYSQPQDANGDLVKYLGQEGSLQPGLIELYKSIQNNIFDMLSSTNLAVSQSMLPEEMQVLNDIGGYTPTEKVAEHTKASSKSSIPHIDSSGHVFLTGTTPPASNSRPNSGAVADLPAIRSPVGSKRSHPRTPTPPTSLPKISSHDQARRTDSKPRKMARIDSLFDQPEKLIKSPADFSPSKISSIAISLDKDKHKLENKSSSYYQESRGKISRKSMENNPDKSGMSVERKKQTSQPNYTKPLKRNTEPPEDTSSQNTNKPQRSSAAVFERLSKNTSKNAVTKATSNLIDDRPPTHQPRRSSLPTRAKPSHASTGVSTHVEHGITDSRKRRTSLGANMPNTPHQGPARITSVIKSNDEIERASQHSSKVSSHQAQVNQSTVSKKESRKVTETDSKAQKYTAKPSESNKKDVTSDQDSTKQSTDSISHKTPTQPSSSKIQPINYTRSNTSNHQVNGTAPVKEITSISSKVSNATRSGAESTVIERQNSVTQSPSKPISRKTSSMVKSSQGNIRSSSKKIPKTSSSRNTPHVQRSQSTSRRPSLSKESSKVLSKRSSSQRSRSNSVNRTTSIPRKPSTSRRDSKHSKQNSSRKSISKVTSKSRNVSDSTWRMSRKDSMPMSYGESTMHAAEKTASNEKEMVTKVLSDLQVAGSDGPIKASNVMTIGKKQSSAIGGDTSKPDDELMITESKLTNMQIETADGTRKESLVAVDDSNENVASNNPIDNYQSNKKVVESRYTSPDTNAKEELRESPSRPKSTRRTPSPRKSSSRKLSRSSSPKIDRPKSVHSVRSNSPRPKSSRNNSPRPKSSRENSPRPKSSRSVSPKSSSSRPKSSKDNAFASVEKISARPKSSKSKSESPSATTSLVKESSGGSAEQGELSPRTSAKASYTPRPPEGPKPSYVFQSQSMKGMEGQRTSSLTRVMPQSRSMGSGGRIGPRSSRRRSSAYRESMTPLNEAEYVDFNQVSAIASSMNQRTSKPSVWMPNQSIASNEQVSSNAVLVKEAPSREASIASFQSGHIFVTPAQSINFSEPHDRNSRNSMGSPSKTEEVAATSPRQQSPTKPSE